MSYVSILKNIPDLLSQPAGIAAIASLGIHGAIAFILPLMPVDSKVAEHHQAIPKTVGLVELNQAEQNRLPQVGTSQIPLQSQVSLIPQVPPLPNFATQSTALPPLPPVASSQLVLPPLPKSPTNLSIASLPKSQSLQTRATKNDFSVNRSFNTQATAQSFPRFQDRVTLGQSQPLPPSNLAQLPTSRVPVVSNSRLPNLEAAQIPANLPRNLPPLAVGTQTASTAVGSPYPQTASSGEQSTAAENRQLVAPIGGTPQVGDNLALAGGTIPSSSAPSLPQFMPRTVASSGQQLISSKPSSFGEQFSEVKQQYRNIQTQLPISKTLTARVGQEGQVDGGLIVNGEGEVESIKFLDNSVSPDLKTSAREYFRDYLRNNQVAANGKPKYYPFSLSFRSNSIEHEAAKQPILPSSQESLVQRLRSPKLNTQPLPTSTTSNQTSRLPQLIPQAPQQQLIPSSSQSLKPFTNLPTRTQPSSIPQANTTQPTTQSRTQPSSIPQAIALKPVTASPLRSQPVPTPQATPSKPISDLRARSKQPTPQATATTSSSKPVLIGSNQPSSFAENSKKLLRQLRELREQRQSPNQDKSSN
ncbi:MAG: hypothetical protein PUP93_34315 [Rhizonema sp. NSF051]|nr:hypothetical protein [Rhizonema sp. NSF051]